MFCFPTPPATATQDLELSVEYKYDAWGNRVERRLDSDGDGTVDVAERSLLDSWNPAKAGQLGNSAWDVWADTTAAGSLTTRYLHGDAIDELLAWSTGSGPNWNLADHLGSVRDITNATGTLVLSQSFDAFGNRLTPADPNAPRYGWTGRESDPATGLQSNRARWYDPSIGRWISQDPIGFDAGDSNLYRYASNRPAQFTDPSGYDDLDVGRARFGGPKQAGGFGDVDAARSFFAKSTATNGDDVAIVHVLDAEAMRRSVVGKKSALTEITGKINILLGELQQVHLVRNKDLKAGLNNPHLLSGDLPLEMKLVIAEQRIQSDIATLNNQASLLLYGKPYEKVVRELEESQLRASELRAGSTTRDSSLGAGPGGWNRMTPTEDDWARSNARRDQLADIEAQRTRVAYFAGSASGKLPPSVQIMADNIRAFEKAEWQGSWAREAMTFLPVVGSAMMAMESFENGDYGWGVFHAVVAGLEIVPFVKGSFAVRMAGRGGSIAPGGARIGGTALWDDIRFANYAPGNSPVMTVPQAREFLQQSGIRGLEHFDLRFLRDAEFERQFRSTPNALAHYGPRNGVAASEVAWTGTFATRTGRVPIDLRVSLFSDREALLGAIRHEIREITEVRRLWRNSATGQFQPNRLGSVSKRQTPRSFKYLLMNAILIIPA